MKIASITGIDGSGKSMLVKQLYEARTGAPAVGVFSCPSYHHIPGSGYDLLSEIFERINLLGNQYKHSDIKALALYLQMSLYGYVAQHYAQTTPAQLLIAESHPLIDTVV